MKIHYTLNIHNPHAHIFKVTALFPNKSGNGYTFSLPAWIPGSYMIRDFAKNIVQIKATSNNSEVKLTKIDKSTWQAEPTSGPLNLEYEVYAWDLSVRSAHLDMTHAFLNGTSLFLMPHGYENEIYNVEIKKPTEKKYCDWKVTTSLTKDKTDSSGFGIYKADNYDELVDHPVEIGTQSEFEFTVENTPHKMALTGVHRADFQRLKSDLTNICQTHCSMFGEFPKMDEYIFLTMVTGDGYGGLEHRNSTSLMCSRDDLPSNNHPEQPNDKYRNFLGLCSHEYFHTWNIKRIKPESFIPYDLTTETYTRQLWAFEGITSYYDELALVRCNAISIESYLELIGQTITRILRGKGRFKQSIAESSFEAWTKFYKQDESAPNNIVSYYAKGALLALCLDLTIRKESNGSKSLDDVMRYLWLNYGKKNIGLAEGEIESITSKVSGIDLTTFFENYLYGVEELPLNSLLDEFGVTYNLRATTTVDDKGGKANKDISENAISLGARFSADPLGAKITQVFNDESAELAGLSAGDIIIAIDHLQVTKSTIEPIVSNYSIGDTLTVHAFRRDELIELSLTLIKAENTTCYLVINDHANEKEKSNLNDWLHV